MMGSGRGKEKDSKCVFCIFFFSLEYSWGVVIAPPFTTYLVTLRRDR